MKRHNTKKEDTISLLGVPLSDVNQTEEWAASGNLWRSSSKPPTKWLDKLLSLAPDVRTAYVVAWIIECVAERVSAEGHHNNCVRWQGLGLSGSDGSAGPRKTVEALRGAVTRQEIDINELRGNMRQWL